MKGRCGASLLIAMAIAGCGGGGGEGGSGGGAVPTSYFPDGLWEGTTSDGRSIAGIVARSNQDFSFIYTVPGNNAVIAGVVQGDAAIDFASKITSSNGKDFNFEGAGILDFTMDGTYREHQSLRGSLRYQNSSLNSTFSATYNPDYDLPASLDVIAGSYTGAAYAGLTEYAEATITASGGLSGQSASGCHYSGNVTPQTEGNYYRVRVSFQDAICANGITQVSGYAYYSVGTKTLYSVGVNSARDNGFIFVGTRP